ncbi:MAG: SET domain-containing protein [Saprospiraceae bacterium]|nr:SET domain-containing protein [Saprospiraceae bacterium]
MFHPASRLKNKSTRIGLGVYATAFIPTGTITYIRDQLEIVIDDAQYARLPVSLQGPVERYAYVDEAGCRVLSWDLGKYVNHCCFPNTMTTGFGFEIAIQDILPGEEITDEYGLFNLESPMSLSCSKPGCRGVVSTSDLDQYYPQWDQQVKAALTRLKEVDQPLWDLVDANLEKRIQDFFADPEQHYPSLQQVKRR